MGLPPLFSNRKAALMEPAAQSEALGRANTSRRFLRKTAASGFVPQSKFVARLVRAAFSFSTLKFRIAGSEEKTANFPGL
jgi:hypothetical protein